MNQIFLDTETIDFTSNTDYDILAQLAYKSQTLKKYIILMHLKKLKKKNLLRFLKNWKITMRNLVKQL